MSREIVYEGHMTYKMVDAEPTVAFSERTRLIPRRRDRRCSSCTTDHDSTYDSDAKYSSSSSESHCHKTKTKPDIDRHARRKLVIACVLSMTFMIGEVIGGVLAHSLAIISDAAHLLTDLASFMISLLALYLASRPASKKLSFGWYRAEILGAMLSILLLWVVTGVLCYMAVERVVNNNFEVHADIMLITAGCGVVFNLVMGLTLHPGGHGHSHGGHGHSHGGQGSSDVEKQGIINDDSLPANGYGAVSADSDGDGNLGQVEDQSNHSHKKHKANINVKAAFVHVVGDLLQSIGVFIAALIIFFKPEWKLADPICTFVFSVIVLVTTITIMRDILIVLMEGTPRHMDIPAIMHSLRNLAEVEDLHDLRIWSLSLDKQALSVHLAVKQGVDTIMLLEKASAMIHNQYGINETTIQVEEYVSDMLDCTHCKDLT